MKRSILLCYTLLSLTGLSAQSAWNPGQHAVIQSSRSDGRFSSSYAIAHQLIKNTRPSLAFRPDFTPKEFLRWQDNVAKAMNELMCFPDYRPEKAPVWRLPRAEGGIHAGKVGVLPPA